MHDYLQLILDTFTILGCCSNCNRKLFLNKTIGEYAIRYCKLTYIHSLYLHLHLYLYYLLFIFQHISVYIYDYKCINDDKHIYNYNQIYIDIFDCFRYINYYMSLLLNLRVHIYFLTSQMIYLHLTNDKNLTMKYLL